MDFFSHLLIGLLVSIFSLQSLGRPFIIYATFMAFLPDLDSFLDFIPKLRNSILFSHKGVSHSYFGALVVSAVFGAFFSLITSSSFMLVWMIGFLFYSLHVTFDSITASKIPLFYPLSKKKYRFIIDRAVNPLLAIFSIISSIILIFIFHLTNSNVFIGASNVFLGIYVFYFSSKLISKIWCQAHLPSSSIYIPGFFPFFYLVREKNLSEGFISFRLLKKFIFSSKNEKVIETKIEIDSKKIEFYKKALGVSSKYVFFSKWEAIIPIIREGENTIDVMLFLAESFARGRAYSLRVIFNKITGEIIEETDDFNFKMEIA